VGTTLDYFEFRGARNRRGRWFATLGECVLGSAVSEELGVDVGGHVVSSPEGVFDLAGVYPLKMTVVGVLDRADTPDDRAVFVDVKTAWVIEGLAHGHEDLAAPGAASGILGRDGDVIVASASVTEYNEITPDNIGTFHFHGDPESFPVTAVLAVPEDERSAAILRGRYLGETERVQIVEPMEVIDDLLATILTVRGYVIAGMLLSGLAAFLTMALVFLLSLRLRWREIETMAKIGGSRPAIASILAVEILLVLATGVSVALLLTAVTGQLGAAAVRVVLF
jgi:putative ABC transport system permease protein